MKRGVLEMRLGFRDAGCQTPRRAEPSTFELPSQWNRHAKFDFYPFNLSTTQDNHTYHSPPISYIHLTAKHTTQNEPHPPHPIHSPTSSPKSAKVLLQYSLALLLTLASPTASTPAPSIKIPTTSLNDAVEVAGMEMVDVERGVASLSTREKASER